MISSNGHNHQGQSVFATQKEDGRPMSVPNIGISKTQTTNSRLPVKPTWTEDAFVKDHHIVRRHRRNRNAHVDLAGPRCVAAPASPHGKTGPEDAQRSADGASPTENGNVHARTNKWKMQPVDASVCDELYRACLGIGHVGAKGASCNQKSVTQPPAKKQPQPFDIDDLITSMTEDATTVRKNQNKNTAPSSATPCRGNPQPEGQQTTNGSGGRKPILTAGNSGSSGCSRAGGVVQNDGNFPPRIPEVELAREVERAIGEERAKFAAAARMLADEEAKNRAVAEAKAEFEKRLSRMNPLCRVANTVMINPDSVDVVGKMPGMTAVGNLLTSVLIKPALAATVYTKSIGHCWSLHFAVIGPSGTGRVTAIRDACACSGVDAVFIKSSVFWPGDLSFAIKRACEVRPALICFEDYQELEKNPDFVREFNYEVLGSGPLLMTFAGVWLVFCMESDDSIKSEKMKRVVGNRYAYVEPIDGRTAAELLMRTFLPASGIPLAKMLTSEQARQLFSAAEGATPEELRAFAGRVVRSALDNVPLAVLASASGASICGDRPNGCENTSGNPAANAGASIVWERDAEPLYENAQTDDESFVSLSSRTIPRISKKRCSAS